MLADCRSSQTAAMPKNIRYRNQSVKTVIPTYTFWPALLHSFARYCCFEGDIKLVKTHFSETMHPDLFYEALFFCARDDLERLQPVSRALLKMIVHSSKVLALRPIRYVWMVR